MKKGLLTLALGVNFLLLNKRRFREVALLLILGIAFEFFSFLFLSFKDIGKGSSSERHLFSPYRAHELNPNYSRKFDTGGKRIHSTQGLRRDSDIEVPKPKNIIRILAMGGSTLYGIGVQKKQDYPLSPTLQNDETIPFFLEKKLNTSLEAKHSPYRVEVINAAVTAYLTFQHPIYFQERLYEMGSDLVIFIEGYNDFFGTNANVNHMRTYNYSSVNLISAINEGSLVAGIYTLAKSLGKYSYFFKLIEKAAYTQIEKRSAEWNHLWTPEKKQEKDESDLKKSYSGYAQNSFLRSYRLMKELGEIYHFETATYLQPQILLEETKYLSEKDKKIREITEKLTQTTSKTFQELTFKRSLLPSLFSSNHLTYFDKAELASSETSKDDLYLDYCHLTKRGSEIAAEKILPHLEKIVDKLIAGKK